MEAAPTPGGSRKGEAGTSGLGASGRLPVGPAGPSGSPPGSAGDIQVLSFLWGFISSQGPAREIYSITVLFSGSSVFRQLNFQAQPDTLWEERRRSPAPGPWGEPAPVFGRLASGIERSNVRCLKPLRRGR